MTPAWTQTHSSASPSKHLSLDPWQKRDDEGFTWAKGESLSELARPERIAQIKERDRIRKEQAAARRKPRNLAEAFGAVSEEDPDEQIGCLICHL